ncbi:MAG: tetratricopeptide (TPR) repeat protein [Cyclobacteriaceae bacterium]|jgi:tetratricopeptide (TPR) repeat protein
MRLFVLVTFISLCFACGPDNRLPGDVYFESGEFNQAIAAYNDYLQSNKATEAVLYNRGRSYEELEKWEEALEDFENVIKINVKSAAAYLSIANVRYEQKRYQQSLLQVAKALEITDSNAQAHFIAARAKHQLGYIEGAMESYTQAIDLNRNYGDAFLYRGALKVATKQTRSACADFLKAKNLRVEGAQDALRKYCK